MTASIADGHNFAQMAYENGVRVFVCERKLDCDAVQIIVNSTRLVIAKIAATLYENYQEVYQSCRNQRKHCLKCSTADNVADFGFCHDCYRSFLLLKWSMFSIHQFFNGNERVEIPIGFD